MNAPKKIWVTNAMQSMIPRSDPNDPPFPAGMKPIRSTVYIRADLVDGLVEALKTCRFSGYTDIDGDYITTQHFDGPKVRAALKSLEEE